MSQLINANSTFHCEHALHESLRRHLGGEIRHGLTLRRSQRHRQCERGFATPDVPAQNGEITASKATANASVEALKTARDRIGVGGALGYRVDLSEELGQ